MNLLFLVTLFMLAFLFKDVTANPTKEQQTLALYYHFCLDRKYVGEDLKECLISCKQNNFILPYASFPFRRKLSMDDPFEETHPSYPQYQQEPTFDVFRDHSNHIHQSAEALFGGYRTLYQTPSREESSYNKRSFILDQLDTDDVLPPWIVYQERIQILTQEANPVTADPFSEPFSK